MVIAVLERRSEIALRRALGATRRRAFPKLAKTAAFVVRGVPRHIREGRERQCRQPVLNGPAGDMVNQGAAHSLAGAVWVHRDLLDMGASIHYVRDHVTNGAAEGVGHHPRPPVRLVAL
jgi:hypothetical protein